MTSVKALSQYSHILKHLGLGYWPLNLQGTQLTTYSYWWLVHVPVLAGVLHLLVSVPHWLARVMWLLAHITTPCPCPLPADRKHPLAGVTNFCPKETPGFLTPQLTADPTYVQGPYPTAGLFSPLKNTATSLWSCC